MEDHTSHPVLYSLLSFVLHSLSVFIALYNVNFAILFVLNTMLTIFGLKGTNFFDEWWRAGLIGNVFAIGSALALFSHDASYIFGYYTMFLASFHITEYFATAVTNPSNLSTDSFLLNHSVAYHVAAVASWLEFWLELYFFPELKSMVYISYLGVAICFGGEVLRKWAMFNAGRNFNHLVQFDKQEDHQLVTDGVFRFMRHPSYVGWFYWSVGTQLILLNPLCLVAYTLASWRFFQERIYFEEYSLLRFFGQDYQHYMEHVPTGIPFMEGFKREMKKEDSVKD